MVNMVNRMFVSFLLSLLSRQESDPAPLDRFEGPPDSEGRLPVEHGRLEKLRQYRI